MMRSMMIMITLACAVPHLAHAQILAPTDAAKPTIRVTGEAELRVVPDQVLISMTVETREKELPSAKKQNDTIVKNFLTYLKEEAAIDPKDIQTDYIHVNPEYVYCSKSHPNEATCNPLGIHYFNVQKGVQIRLNDLDKYEEIIEKSIAFGVTRINNVQFITTELRTHRDKARELAAKAAKEKAEAIAHTLGMEIVEPISINLNHSNWSYWSGSRHGRNMMMQNSIQSVPSDGGASANASLALGQINISAKVNVVFNMR